jgi:hypothetical protein
LAGLIVHQSQLSTICSISASQFCRVSVNIFRELPLKAADGSMCQSQSISILLLSKIA